MILFAIATATVIGVVSFYLYFTSKYNYFKDRGIPCIKPRKRFENFIDTILFRKHFVYVLEDIYNQLKDNRYGGFFQMRTPTVMITDPSLVHQILVKDFTFFYDRGPRPDIEHEPLTGNLFNLEGERWRYLRNKLTPVFTTGKLKGMFDQVCKCGDQLVAHIEKQSKIGESLETKSLFNNFTLDVIASCAFGIQMDKDSEAGKNYLEAVHEFFNPSKIQIIRFLLIISFPDMAKKFGFKGIPDKIEKFCIRIVKDTLKFRQDNDISRNDFLQLLLNLRKEEESASRNSEPTVEHDDDDDVIDQMKYTSKVLDENPAQNNLKVITDGCMAAQSFVFLIAGSETVYVPMNYTLFCLSQDQGIQKKVQNEIDSVLRKHNYEWSYQAVREMTYLDQVIQETLRMYSVVTVLSRTCTKTYKIPGTNHYIEKGIQVLLPIQAIQNDPNNYKSPEKFDPERFVDNNFKPSGKYIPFGDGPRICIGMRFAIVELKVALSRILLRFNVKLSRKTKLPLKFQALSPVPYPEGGLWFDFEKRG